MTTPLTDVFDSFLSSISDYTFVSVEMTPTDLENELFGYLRKAVSKFYKCRNDLTINKDTMEFASELTFFEIEILSSLMVVEYLKPKILSTETLKQSLSDKDFKIYSQANQLREMKEVYRLFFRESRKLIVEYTFFDIEKKMSGKND